MKNLFSIILILISWSTYADEMFPSGCKPIVAKDKSVMLLAQEPMLIMIHNLSKHDLWVAHPVSEPSASAGWSSRLQAGNWSALALRDKSFELICIESKPGHEQQIPCAGVLAVCQWMNITEPDRQETGTFWAGEDMALPALTAYLGRRGFVVPTTLPYNTPTS